MTGSLRKFEQGTRRGLRSIDKAGRRLTGQRESRKEKNRRLAVSYDGEEFTRRGEKFTPKNSLLGE